MTTSTRAGAADIRAVYLANSVAFRRRRLSALVVLSLLLLIPLVVISTNGWWEVAGGASIGLGWAIALISTIVCALAAVAIDIIYRKDI